MVFCFSGPLRPRAASLLLGRFLLPPPRAAREKVRGFSSEFPGCTGARAGASSRAQRSAPGRSLQPPGPWLVLSSLVPRAPRPLIGHLSGGVRSDWPTRADPAASASLRRMRAPPRSRPSLQPGCFLRTPNLKCEVSPVELRGWEGVRGGIREQAETPPVLCTQEGH